MKWTARLLALACASTLGACCIEPEGGIVAKCAPYPCATAVGTGFDYGYARGYYGYDRGEVYRPGVYGRWNGDGRSNGYGRANFSGRPIPYGRPTPSGRPSPSHGGWHGGGTGGSHGSGSHQGHR